MSDAGMTTQAGGWRLIEPTDLPFIYELVTKVDPRWWRFSRHGLDPATAIVSASAISAGVIVFDDAQQPVACGVLTETGASGTGTFEFYALPNPEAERLARLHAPALLAAAFQGASIRRIYHERFAGDVDLLGAAGLLFEVEVTFPEFAMIAGRYEDRTISVLTIEAYEPWYQAREGRPTPAEVGAP
jgi:hypothetical protein